MKGPGSRLKFDMRRHWECPVCHRREWTSGEVVNHACTCTGTPDGATTVWMRLIEPKASHQTPLIAPALESPPPEVDRSQCVPSIPLSETDAGCQDAP